MGVLYFVGLRVFFLMPDKVAKLLWPLCFHLNGFAGTGMFEAERFCV